MPEGRVLAVRILTSKVAKISVAFCSQGLMFSNSYLKLTNLEFFQKEPPKRILQINQLHKTITKTKALSKLWMNVHIQLYMDPRMHGIDITQSNHLMQIHARFSHNFYDKANVILKLRHIPPKLGKIIFSLKKGKSRQLIYGTPFSCHTGS